MLAGCSGGGGEPLQAGQWDMSFEVTEVTSSTEDGIEDELNRSLSRNTMCFSEEDAAAPTAAMILGDDLMEECNVTSSTIADGSIEIAAVCGDSGTFNVSGTYGGALISADVDADISSRDDRFVFDATITRNRTGDC